MEKINTVRQTQMNWLTHTLTHFRGLILPPDYLQHAAGMPIVCLCTRLHERDPTDTYSANPFKHTLHKHTPLCFTKSHKFSLAVSLLFPLLARSNRKASFVDAVHRPGGLAVALA